VAQHVSVVLATGNETTPWSFVTSS